MPIDISDTLLAKSDQLNADDLVGGPITVRILGVSRGNADQPVTVKIDGGHKPWMPCKTTRRVLAFAWGTDAEVWVGRTVRLFRDPDVKWAGDLVGGIRISGLSHIPKNMTIKLAETKGGKKVEQRVEKLEAAADRAPTTQRQPAKPQRTEHDNFLDAVNNELGLDRADVAAFLAGQGITVTDRPTGEAVWNRMLPGGDLRAAFDKGPEVQS